MTVRKKILEKRNITYMQDTIKFNPDLMQYVFFEAPTGYKVKAIIDFPQTFSQIHPSRLDN